MKNKIIHLMLAVVVATGLSACGDGSASNDGPNPSVSALEKSVFNVSAVGEEGEGGGSVEINKGGSIVLEWDIGLPEGADQEKARVTLDSEELSVHTEDLKVKDQMTIDDIDVAATFTLTAEYEGARVTRSVDVKIKDDGAPFTVTFTVDSSTIYKGESVSLCWEVSQSDVSIVITDSDSKEVLSPPKLSGETASSCAAITPEKTMKYTMKASTEDGETITKSVDVTVKKKLFSRKLKKLSPVGATELNQTMFDN